MSTNIGAAKIYASVSAVGAFVQGFANDANLQVTASGGFAQGYALRGNIEATGKGAFAHGATVADANPITASGQGSFAVGDSTNGTIVASASNAFQFGPGTNSVAESTRFGTAGLHMKHTTGAFGTPTLGQFWINSTFTYLRSDGVSFKFDQSSAWTPTNVTTDRSFDANSTTLDELSDIVGTIILDLQNFGILG